MSREFREWFQNVSPLSVYETLIAYSEEVIFTCIIILEFIIFVDTSNGRPLLPIVFNNSLK